ncbi:MAG: hypothetical protein ABEJ65_06215, partial [bacterium]
ILGMPVRLGEPYGVSGLIDVVSNPKYATGVGLVLYGFEHTDQSPGFQPGGQDIFENLSRTMSDWFEGVGSMFSGATS